MERKQYVEKRAENNTAARTNKQCKDCNLSCVLKKHLIGNDAECWCPINDARYQAEIYGHPVVDNNVLFTMASKALKVCHNKVRDFKTGQAYFDMVIKMKSTFYPETQKVENVNYNMNVAQEIVDAIIENKMK